MLVVEVQDPESAAVVASDLLAHVRMLPLSLSWLPSYSIVFSASVSSTGRWLAVSSTIVFGK